MLNLPLKQVVYLSLPTHTLEHHNQEVDEMTTQAQNTVLLEGIPLAAPELSHKTHATSFYRFIMEVPRLSGQHDHIPVLLLEAMISRVNPGTPLRLRGQMRSFNNRSGQGSRLVLTVYALELLPPQGEFCNEIFLAGTLCKPPVFRRTPLGRSICDLMLAVTRRYGRSDYLPVIAWGQLAALCSQYNVGDALCLEGRIQSRTYRKVLEDHTEVRTAYEVSVLRLLPPEESPHLSE